MRKLWMQLTGFVVLVALAVPVLAEKVTLKDGTVLEGTVIKQGDNYWIKTSDGRSRTVAASEVASIGGAATPSVSTPAPSSSGSHNFLSAKRKADAVETPLAAVSIWQKFIEDNAGSADEGQAKSEMEKWKKLADEGAEKIGGKWVGGEERKTIIDKSEKLTREGGELLRGQQTLQAVKKFEEAQRIYPNSFEVNFWLGYVSLLQDKNDPAIKYFEMALRQRPNSPETHNNIGVAWAMKKQLDKAILSFHKAAETEDSREIASNLVTALALSPPAMQRAQRMKPAADAASLLGSKYGINGPATQFLMVYMRPEGDKNEKHEHAGMMSSGTGFLIDDTGLILTNRHVVEGGKTFMVMLNGDEQRSAEVVVMDNEQDLALVRIKPKEDEKLPFLQLSKADFPGDGAECTVMGFPMIDRLGAAIKVTRGIVSSGSSKNVIGPDVVIDAKVNPGNSGGPILDRFGNVMAIVSMKSLANAMEDSYGLGISAGRVRQFLEKNKVAVLAAAAGDTSLNAEEIAKKVKPATVCIIATH